MRIAVYGLWHLGCVTAACLAEAGHHVVGLDRDSQVVAQLCQGQPPLFEPGLQELIRDGLNSGRLAFASPTKEILADAEMLWVTFDTPVNERDEADVAWVRAQLEAIVDFIPRGILLLISSQVPVGFTGALENDWHERGLRFAYSPENLRLGQALESFRNPQRVVVGIRHASDQPLLNALFAPFGGRIEWMTVESAEMTKHALNAFLATSVAFANEIARLCDVVGADAKEVERGLKSEPRIGPGAYLAPGAAFAGGTLARDLHFLTNCGEHRRVATPLLQGALTSNDVHKNWLRDKLSPWLNRVSAPVAAMLGLACKPGTSSLRRSSAVENALWLHQQGVRVQAHDPALVSLPEKLRSAIVLCDGPQAALAEADVAIIATAWPVYRDLTAQDFVDAMRQPCIIDPTHFLADRLAKDIRLHYIATGKAGQPNLHASADWPKDRRVA